MTDKNLEKLNSLFDKYQLEDNSKSELSSIIMPIFSHQEFQKRMSPPYFHHDKITLGEHIIEDAIVTYNLSKIYLQKKNDPNFSIVIAVQIAMLHDLYTYPWQNNKEYKSRKIYNKHGFRHPLEAVINAITWYPMLFEDLEEAIKIIDGIIGHMYPLPVRRYHKFDTNKLELNNYNLLKDIDKNLEDILILYSNKSPLGPFSFKHKTSIEGRIMRRSDRIVSYHNFIDSRSIKAIFSLFTGKNNNLTNY